jgi:hypothetical protein
MLAHREQYHKFKPYWTMLDFPVLTSVLGVRWHREHLASSGVENISRDVRELEALDEEEALEDEVTESSLVTCNRFCWGTGEGLIGDSWAAAVCILKKSFETLLLLLVVAWGGRYASNG